MISSPKPPAYPDPKVTAAAQSSMNIDTAQASQLTNMINQATPDGSLNYSKSGDYTYVDQAGKTVTIPQYTATQTYSPSQQKLYDLGNQTQQKIGEIGLSQAGKIGDLLGSPVDLSNEATEARLFDLGAKRLDPKFAQQEDQLRTQLANQGIQPGSQAWNAQMQQLGQNKNDAYNQLALTGRGQATQEALAQRNQPINEISALLNGSQVSQPNFMGTPQAQVAGVDYTGMVNQQYQSQMAAYNAKIGQQNAMMGGIFGIGGSIAGALPWSDRRLKTDIRRVGELDNGLGVYSYRFKAGGPMQIGVMAQEVQGVHPEAVHEVGGYLAVDYNRAVEA